MQPRSTWRISIGSSIVTMCWFRERLILSTIAASVVDLPEPVAPVTRIRPRCSSASFSTPIGRPSFSNDGTSNGTWRKANEMAPRWRNPLTRKRPVFPAVYEMSRSPVSRKTSRLAGEFAVTTSRTASRSRSFSDSWPSATSEPSMRAIGGESTLRCRSLPLCSTAAARRAFRSMDSLAIGRGSPCLEFMRVDPRYTSAPTGEFPSGQRGPAVNRLAPPSQVRILPPPFPCPDERLRARGASCTGDRALRSFRLRQWACIRTALRRPSPCARRTAVPGGSRSRPRARPSCGRWR